MLRIGITGANGFLAWHARVRLLARNAAARFSGETEPFEIVLADRAVVSDDERLDAFVASCDAILHLAGVNRGDPEAVRAGNLLATERLIGALERAEAIPHIVFANSTHSDADTPYGTAKREAAAALTEWSIRRNARFADLVLPHLFGEGGRPGYNMVTATLCHRRARGEIPDIRPGAVVQLVHAGAAVERALEALTLGEAGRILVEGRSIQVDELDARIAAFHDLYRQNVFPDLSDPFELALFNTYRSHIPPEQWPRRLDVKRDERGTLFEAAKGGGGGQSFVSSTVPGAVRGNHFHLGKVERFLVLEGEAMIRIRRVCGEETHEFRVSGAMPTAVDMPTLHTHNIENVGRAPLVMLFWAHEIFDPAAPDTYYEPV